MHPIISLAGAIALPLGVGVLASTLSLSAVKTLWPRLRKPPWCPPPSLFGPMWSVMYLAMGTASWLAARAGGGPAALVPYAVQLALNAVWNPLFFVGKRADAALVDIVALGGMAAYTAVKFWEVSTVAGVLMLPYLAWIGVATALNWEFYQRNGAVLKGDDDGERQGLVSEGGSQ